MADDTLSPVGFDRPFIKAYLGTETRFAMACLSGAEDLTETDTVRMVLLAGLDALGWTEQKAIEEYARYRVRCLNESIANAYGRE